MRRYPALLGTSIHRLPPAVADRTFVIIDVDLIVDSSVEVDGDVRR
jgi:hypothetical protein